jgi:ribosomal protein S18 acetylase RimI-like enzyme
MGLLPKNSALAFAMPGAGRPTAPNAVQRQRGVEAFAVNLRPKAGGHPLPDTVRSKMEKAFGADFSDVRVHVGREAHSVGAIAFTWGSHIHFAPGQYNPHSLQGQKLLGHELTHVLQQRAGRVKNPYGSGVAVVQDRGLEAEADRMGLRAAMTPTPRRSGPAAMQAKPASAPKPVQRYMVRQPQPAPGGAHTITATAMGSSQPVGSVNLWSRDRGIAEITDLNVQPEHRRQGVAKTLVNAAIQNARLRGFAKARLEARPSDRAMQPNVLVSMYQRMGFRAVGVSKRGVPLLERSTASNIY